jgi:hypothetical protein
MSRWLIELCVCWLHAFDYLKRQRTPVNTCKPRRKQNFHRLHLLWSVWNPHIRPYEYHGGRTLLSVLAPFSPRRKQGSSSLSLNEQIWALVSTHFPPTSKQETQFAHCAPFVLRKEISCLIALSSAALVSFRRRFGLHDGSYSTVRAAVSSNERGLKPLAHFANPAGAEDLFR